MGKRVCSDCGTSLVGTHANTARCKPCNRLKRIKSIPRTACAECGGSTSAKVTHVSALVAPWKWEGVTMASSGEAEHPADVERLMRYWAEGADAAKISWATPGDFRTLPR